MQVTPKQIIIDKDAFVGIKMKDLCRFAGAHLLLLCDTLLYECATATKQDSADLLRKCACLIKAGAYYCGCSVGYIQWEGRHLTPYPRFLPDRVVTDTIRTDEVRLEDASVLSITDDVFFSRSEVARRELTELSAELKRQLDSENPEVGKVIRKESPVDTKARIEKLLERMDTRDMHQISVDSVPADWIKDKTRFCLSPEWMAWHFARLTKVVVQDYYYLRQMGGPPGDTRAEHDYQDIEYVFLLSRADGIITCDKKLVEPLARAAFPEKRVFSRLEDVPESYRCDRMS